MAGKMDKSKGRAKTGEMADDEKLKSRGRVDKAKGESQAPIRRPLSNSSTR
jgi:uncharacterized protein YjbJ (UPF0337 family)